MPIAPGTYELGPQNATLLVNTKRRGAASKAGHDLEIEVTSWSATLELRDPPNPPSVALSVDATSLRVREGRGGIQALGEDDKDNIRQTIDDEVLKGGAIEFRARQVEVSSDGNHMHVEGELELGGTKRPIAFDLKIAQGGRLMGGATVKQSEWRIKPYSALFGALKVADEVEVTIDADLSAGSGAGP